MPKKVIHQKASDNVYLHKDFHGVLSAGIDYLQGRYGDKAVREYLRRFTNSFYAPLKADLARRGLIALKEHFEQVYRAEDGDGSFSLSADELVIEVSQCPAVMHMRRRGYPVASLWSETTRTVNEALCEGTDFEAELVDYDDQTGRGRQSFLRARK